MILQFAHVVAHTRSIIITIITVEVVYHQNVRFTLDLLENQAKVDPIQVTTVALLVLAATLLNCVKH